MTITTRNYDVRSFAWQRAVTLQWYEGRITTIGDDMSGGAYWRWYLGRTDIERVLVSAGDMPQKRNEKYRMIGWQQLTDDDASVEVFWLDRSEPGGAHVAMITECDHVDEARERFVQFLELAVEFFASGTRRVDKVDVEVEPL